MQEEYYSFAQQIFNLSWPRGCKTFSMLVSTEHEIFSAHKNLMLKCQHLLAFLTFMSRKNSILSLSEPEKKTDFLDIFILMSIRNFMLS